MIGWSECAWGGRTIEVADSAAPQVSEIRRSGSDLLVVLSEPVQPGLAEDSAGASGLIEGLQNVPGTTLLDVIELFDANNVALAPPTVVHEDVADFPEGTVLRVVNPSLVNGERYTLRVQAGTLVDDWTNGVPATAVDFVNVHGQTVLASTGYGVGSTMTGSVVPVSTVGNEVGSRRTCTTRMSA